MSRYEHGRVLAVNEVRLGSELVADHTANSTTLTVDDPVDFDEDGGWLTINGQAIEYSKADDDTGVLTLLTVLAFDADEGDRVDLWDAENQVITTDKVAHVELDGDAFNDDSIEATIPLHLAAQVGEGIRSLRGESVLLELDGGEWRITDMLGLATKGGGGGASTLDDLTDVTAPIATVADRELLAFDFAAQQWKPYGPVVHHGTVLPADASLYPWQFFVKHS